MAYPFFELHVVQPLEIHKRGNDVQSLTGMHIRFTFRNTEKYCGFVQSSSRNELVVRLTILDRLVSIMN